MMSHYEQTAVLSLNVQLDIYFAYLFFHLMHMDHTKEFGPHIRNTYIFFIKSSIVSTLPPLIH